MNEKCVILLIKDNPRIFNICSKMIEQNGTKVAGADTLAEVIGRINEKPAEVLTPAVALTKKELAVAALVAAQLNNKEIAEQMCVSESRVKTCLTGIYRKYGLSDRRNKRKRLVAVQGRV